MSHTSSQQMKLKIVNLFSYFTYFYLIWDVEVCLCSLAGFLCLFIYYIRITLLLPNERAQFIACPNSPQCWSIPNWEILKGLMWNRKRKTFPHDRIVSQPKNELELPHAPKMQIYVCRTNADNSKSVERTTKKKWFVDATKTIFHTSTFARGHVWLELMLCTKARDNF